jgi:hypothetical protein
MSELNKKRNAYKMAKKGKDRITIKDVEMAENIAEARSKYQEDDAGEGYKGTPDLYPDYDIDFEEEFKKIDAEKMVGGGIARPEQPIKGVKPIQVKGRKFQGIF